MIADCVSPTAESERSALAPTATVSADMAEAKGLYGSDSAANMVRSATAELVGTAILVFVGTSVAVGAILARPTAGGAYDSLAVALAFGLGLVALVGALGHVSGAHLNPAVTLALAATKKFPWAFVPAYMASQIVGAVVGALATWVAYGGPARSRASLAATFPASGVSDLRALLVEMMITFVLVLVIMAVATDERVPSTSTASLAVGFALAVGVLIGGPVSGGAVNPARALGPMIVAGKFTAFWVYIVGPIAGGVLAAMLYDRFLAQAEAPELEGGETSSQNEPGRESEDQARPPRHPEHGDGRRVRQ